MQKRSIVIAAIAAGLALVANAATVNIAANGGEIPNSPDDIVSITSAGSGDGGITLASGVTDATIASLEQNSTTPATVNLAAEQTLSVKGIKIASGQGDLTFSGSGWLQQTNSAIYVTNANADATLTLGARMRFAEGNNGTPLYRFNSGGNGPLVLNATEDWTNRVLLCIVAGTNYIRGSGTIYQSRTNTASSSEWVSNTSCEPCLVYDGCKVISGRSYFSIAKEANSRGRIIFRNGAHVDNQAPKGSSASTVGGITLGHGNGAVGYAIVEGADTWVRHLFNVGYSYNANGVVIQKGGTFIPYHSWQTTVIGGSGGGYGYLEVQNGDCLPSGYIRTGYGNYGGSDHSKRTMGIIVVKGGTFSCGNLMMCPSSNGDAWMIHRGGSVSITGSSHLSGESANHLNIYSGYILDAQGCTSTITSHYLGYATNATTHLVVHEGTMSMPGCSRSGPADNGATVYVALNGGTMQARQANSSFFGSTSKPIEHVTVYPRGITFDTQSYAITIPTVLAGPTGKGVAAIPMTAEVSAAGKFIGTPLVVITGDGQGAVAYCDYDSDTKTVNSIRVVSPGWGYTTATASIYRGGMAIGAKIDLPCTLTEGDLAGGDFIKTGSGTLTISGANTWLGDLVVSNGTVKLEAAAALPATAAAHVRAGATLNMNGQAFNGLLGTGGGTVSGNVAAAKGWKVRVADLGTTMQVTGTLSFAAGATLTVDDPAQLAEGKYTLVTATGGISGDLPTVSVPREYGRWQLLQVNNSLVFCPLKGATIIFR